MKDIIIKILEKSYELLLLVMKTEWVADSSSLGILLLKTSLLVALVGLIVIYLLQTIYDLIIGGLKQEYFDKQLNRYEDNILVHIHNLRSNYSEINSKKGIINNLKRARAIRYMNRFEDLTDDLRFKVKIVERDSQEVNTDDTTKSEQVINK